LEHQKSMNHASKHKKAVGEPLSKNRETLVTPGRARSSRKKKNTESALAAKKKTQQPGDKLSATGRLRKRNVCPRQLSKAKRTRGEKRGGKNKG